MITLTWWGFYSIIDDVLGRLELAIIIRGGGGGGSIVVVIPNK